MEKYRVTLTEEEGKNLEQVISRDKGAARKLLHARILLKADETVGWSNERISEALEVSLSTCAGYFRHPGQFEALCSHGGGCQRPSFDIFLAQCPHRH